MGRGRLLPLQHRLPLPGLTPPRTHRRRTVSSVLVLLVRGLEDRCLLIPLTLLDEVILPGAQPAAVLYLGKDLQGSFKCST